MGKHGEKDCKRFTCRCFYVDVLNWNLVPQIYQPQTRFYTHVLGLPLFLIYYKEINEAFITFSDSPLISLKDLVGTNISFDVIGFMGDVRLPRLWYFLILNSITQYICISGVHRLSSVATSVTLNLMLTLRKFVSLMLSVLIFGNPFGPLHAFGAVSVLSGTLLYGMAKDIKNVTLIHQDVNQLKKKQ